MFPAFTSSNSSLNTTTGTTFGSGITNLYDRNLTISSGTITFGTHTFTADQLGHLLSILLAQHTEVSL